jgi:hypothetical protein
MCFSATASFAASAILTPVGIYTLARSYGADRRYLALAAFPLLFGIQQATEGFEWLALEEAALPDIHTAALGFLFFAYFLWPLMVPLSAYFVEENHHRRGFFALLSLVGGLYGLSLYFPLLLNEDWLAVQLVQGSILYQPTLIYDGVIPRTGLRIFYAAIIGLALLFSTVKTVRIFGVIVLISVIAGFLFFAYAFTSIWCFLAAILSIYVLHIVQRISANNESG